MNDQKKILESIRDIISTGGAPSALEEDEILDLTQMVNPDGTISMIRPRYAQALETSEQEAQKRSEENLRSRLQEPPLFEPKPKEMPKEPMDILSEIDSILSTTPAPEPQLTVPIPHEPVAEPQPELIAELEREIVRMPEKPAEPPQEIKPVMQPEPEPLPEPPPPILQFEPEVQKTQPSQAKIAPIVIEEAPPVKPEPEVILPRLPELELADLNLDPIINDINNAELENQLMRAESFEPEPQQSFSVDSTQYNQALKQQQVYEQEILEENMSNNNDSLISGEAAGAARSSITSMLEKLQKPKNQSITPFRSGETMEDLVMEMMKPLLKEWLDHNLPPMVQAIVEREIKKILPNA